MDLTAEQVLSADERAFSHDPFDALIVATATSMNMPLVTRDAAIRASGAVAVIWS